MEWSRVAGLIDPDLNYPPIIQPKHIVCFQRDQS